MHPLMQPPPSHKTYKSESWDEGEGLDWLWGGEHCTGSQLKSHRKVGKWPFEDHPCRTGPAKPQARGVKGRLFWGCRARCTDVDKGATRKVWGKKESTSTSKFTEISI